MTTEIEDARVNSTDVQEPRGVNRASGPAHGIGSVYTPAALAEWTGLATPEARPRRFSFSESLILPAEMVNYWRESLESPVSELKQ